MFFFAFWHLHLVLLCVSQHILYHKFFEFVAILQIGEFAYNAVDSVHIHILYQLLVEWSNFRINHLLLLLLLLLIRSRHYLQEIRVLLFDYGSLPILERKVSIRPNDHAFYQIFLQSRQL
jgi:hypothetical protein